MDLLFALIVYLLLVIGVYLIARTYGIRIFSAITFAVLVGILALSIIYPYSNMGQQIHRYGLSYLFTTGAVLYFIIQVITGILLVLYILNHIHNDRVMPSN